MHSAQSAKVVRFKSSKYYWRQKRDHGGSKISDIQEVGDLGNRNFLAY